MNCGDAERVVGTAPRIRAIWQLLEAIKYRGVLARRARPALPPRRRTKDRSFER